MESAAQRSSVVSVCHQACQHWSITESGRAPGCSAILYQAGPRFFDSISLGTHRGTQLRVLLKPHF